MDVERTILIEFATDDDPTDLARFPVALRVPGVPAPTDGVERSGSTVGKLCTGIEILLLPAKDGIDDECLLALTEGTGTGVALGERERAGVFSLLVLMLLCRTVVLPLANEALEVDRGLEFEIELKTFLPLVEVDTEDDRAEDLRVDFEKRDDDSEGVIGAFADIDETP